MPRLRPARGVLLALCILQLALAGCSHIPFFHHRPDKLKTSSPEVLYKTARKQLDNYDYGAAIKTYEALTARFPFTDQARQAHIDLIYVYYRQGERESAIDAADQFIRENPTHPRVDYAWYLKGLVDFSKTPNFLEKAFHADLTQRAPINARKSFDAFNTVVTQFPQSEYAPDARRRMIYLRDRLADFDISVARYYISRTAYLAAAQRAKEVVEVYDGSPATREALQIMIQAYDRLDLKQPADQAREVYALNFSGTVNQSSAVVTKKPWWRRVL